MSRFLFHSLPLTGHVHPIAAVAQALAEWGHDVAWTGSEAFLRPLLGPDAKVYPTGLRLFRGDLRDTGMTATKSRWAGYIAPHTTSTLAAVERAVEAHRPDVIAVDQHAIAGALAAHRAGVRWASLAPTTVEIARPYRHMPKVDTWIRGLMASLWTGAGLPDEPPHDLRFSPHLVIAFTSAALVGEELAKEVALVGPALASRRATVAFPWEWLDPEREHVLVTVGTLSMDVARDFYRRVVQAVRPLADRLRVIVVSPEAALPDPPPHVLVVPRVPMLELMRHLRAVVSHGGLNTVCEALAHGVPLIVAPIKGDQPINAGHVVAAGAGRRVRFGRARPAEIRAAILAVLDDPTYRHAARRVGDSFRAAGGTAAAAGHLERLALALPPRPPPPPSRRS